MILAILDARRAVLTKRLDAIIEMGIADHAFAELHAMLEESLVLRDLYAALLREKAAA